MEVWRSGPWPWYLAGPLIGLFVPALLLVGNKGFGISSNLRHICSAVVPGGIKYFQYDWKKTGLWNLLFLGSIRWRISRFPLGHASRCRYLRANQGCLDETGHP